MAVVPGNPTHPVPSILLRLSRQTDVILAALLMLIVAMLIVPLPEWLLDTMLVVNITLSATIMLVALYNTEPLRLGATPTDDGDLDSPGYFSPLRGKTSYSDRWDRVSNGWQHWIVPDRIIRTYEGYGYNPAVAPEVDAHLYQSGTWRIDDVEFVNDEVRAWTDVAGQLLGIDGDDLSPRGHVGNLICWRRDNVLAMTERIENVAGIDWRTALMRLPTFSEYVLYGAHTRAVLGYEGALHHPSTLPLVKASWGLDLANASALDTFFAVLDPATVAVMIHSKDEIDPLLYRDHLAAMWDAAG